MLPTKPPTVPAPDTVPIEPEVVTDAPLSMRPTKPPTSVLWLMTTVFAVEPVMLELYR